MTYNIFRFFLNFRNCPTSISLKACVPILTSYDALKCHFDWLTEGGISQVVAANLPDELPRMELYVRYLNLFLIFYLWTFMAYFRTMQIHLIYIFSKCRVLPSFPLLFFFFSFYSLTCLLFHFLISSSNCEFSSVIWERLFMSVWYQDSAFNLKTDQDQESYSKSMRSLRVRQCCESIWIRRIRIFLSSWIRIH